MRQAEVKAEGATEETGSGDAEVKGAKVLPVMLPLLV